MQEKTTPVKLNFTDPRGMRKKHEDVLLSHARISGSTKVLLRFSVNGGIYYAIILSGIGGVAVLVTDDVDNHGLSATNNMENIATYVNEVFNGQKTFYQSCDDGLYMILNATYSPKWIKIA